MNSTDLMKHILTSFLYFITVFSVNVFAGNSSRIVFYVSPSGNDEWSGRLPQSNASATDGPFKTLEKARWQVEQINAQQQMPGEDIEIIIRGGTYMISKTFVLSHNSSGNTGKAIVWKSYPGEKVQLMGSKEITGFHTITDTGTLKRINPAFSSHIMEIDLKAQGITDYGTITSRGGPGTELFFNNQKMPLSRWTNEGWATIADVPQTGELMFKGDLQHLRFGFPVGRHYGKFTYAEDRPAKWSDISNIILHGYWTWDWYDEMLQIQSIDTAAKTIYIRPQSIHYGLSKGQRYYAMNILEELDKPGEWCLDRNQGKLYFWPPSPLQEAKVFISLLDQPLMQINQSENVYIEGISFEFSRGNGLVINGGKNNIVSGCTFSNLGNTAVVINGGEKNGVLSCNIFDVAFGGIAITGGDRNTLTAGEDFATNNDIHDISQWIRTYQPAIKIAGVGNYIQHNRIHEVPGAGILLNGNEHIIEYNELFNLALETGDVGGFYMGRDWTERGNIIRYNYFHDLKGTGAHDVNAVYLDDWASGTTVYSNIFSNCARAVMIGGGRDNIIDNNIFVDCTLAIHVDSRGLGWAKYYFDGTDNTLFNRMDAVHYTQPPFSIKYPALLSLYQDEPAVAKHNSITHNIAYGCRWLDLHNDLTLKIVQVHDNLLSKVTGDYQSDRDKVSKKNLWLYNTADKDFRVSPKAFREGFKVIPYSKIGLQKDSFRMHPQKTFSYK